MGRRSKRTPAVVSAVLEALAAGHARWPAAALAGIGGTTLARWIEDDPDLAARVAQAEALAEANHLAVITRAAEAGTWQAAAWWLERRAPERWGRRRTTADQADRSAGTIILRWADEHDAASDPLGAP